MEPAGKIQVEGREEPMVQDQPETQLITNPPVGSDTDEPLQGASSTSIPAGRGSGMLPLEWQDFDWRREHLELPGEDSKRPGLVRVEYEPGALSNRGANTRIRENKSLLGPQQAKDGRIYSSRSG
jgi:hypothetical protein